MIQGAKTHQETLYNTAHRNTSVVCLVLSVQWLTEILPTLLQEGRNITSSEDPQVLVLTNVTEKDAGWYTCIAANSLGTSFSTAYLSVTDGEWNLRA